MLAALWVVVGLYAVLVPVARCLRNLWLIPVVLRGRCRHESEWLLTRRQRLWFTCKAVISLAIDYERHPDYPYSGTIMVGMYNGQKTESFEYGTGYDWDMVNVHMCGLGYFLSSDGWP